MELELRHLRMVLAIAEAGSVTKAAASLGLAQPALTTQLQRIERILGGPLFTRDRRGVAPTPLGDLVLARARVLIPAVTGLHDEASELITAGGDARYRLGATNGPIVAGLVRRLGDAHPGGPVSIHSTWSENEVAQMTVAGRLDYAVVGACSTPPGVLPAGLTWRAISIDAVWVLLNDEHPLAGRDEVGLGELAGEAWITAPGDGCFLECFAAACAREGFAPRSPTSIDASSAFDMVAGGSAVALCQGLVRSAPGTVAVPLRGVPLRWRHLLGWDPDGPAAAHAAEVFGYAVEAYLEIVGQRPRYERWLATQPSLGVQKSVSLLRRPGRAGGRGDAMIA
ncbi:LysR family transcriptional regulator [Actinoplanes sp. CA-030573]|uniref:LysR family transcriptional regulator n=1 Tax=Actinoplanes sp. CA-030573 TaxID=3239898 RepID=UPI003D94AF01